jgi:hypothetical protein
MESNRAVSTHTNARWYPYPDLGSYFQLVNGTLWQRPMLQSGGIGTESAEVDWFRGVAEEDMPRLQEIVRELGAKG